MKKQVVAFCTLIAGAGAAHAERLDRSGQSILPLFEPGGYAEISFGNVNPSVSGTFTSPFGSAGSGNMTTDYWQIGIAYKQQMTEAFSFGFIYDRPFGADVAYPLGTGYPIAGTTAELKTEAFTILGNYRFDSGFGMHGGVRIQRLEASANIVLPSPPPAAPGNYRVEGQADEGLGYVLGVSYERPDIALRVALTYNSDIETKNRTVETSPVPGPTYSTTTISTPQSVNLDFQTGIAKDTLIFGSIRWVDWSEFDIDPGRYPLKCAYNAAANCGPLISYGDDSWTYTAGVGRRFNENWSGSLQLAYEKNDQSQPSSNLGPTSGRWGLTLGGRYEDGPYVVAGGLNYTWLGDVTTANIGGRFEDNHAVGIGVKLGYRF